MPNLLQTEVKDPYRLELKNSDLQDKVDMALCQIVRETVQANYDRDWQLRALRDQLEGFSQPNANTPWPGACQIESTISRELHTTLCAATWNGARQTPYVCIESVDPDTVDQASNVETYLNLKAQQYQFDDALYSAIYLAMEGRYSVMYQYTHQPIQRYFELETPEELQAEGEEPQGEQGGQDQINLREEPKDFCVKFRCPDPWDFYVYPSTARGPEIEDGCLIAVEKMYLTQEDLMMGVINEGYDKEQVLDMIDKGPASLQGDDLQDRGDDFNRDGILNTPQDKSRDAGVWQCFQMIGRMPLCETDDNSDGEMRPSIPDTLQHVDCLWMVCPALNIRFKQAYSPCPQGIRPYTVFNVIDKPNRMLGEGICSILSPIHEEMTAIERFGINNMNLEASPVMTVAESWLTRYSKWTIAPGRFMPRQSGDPVGPRALTWDVRSQQLIMPWLQALDAQANRLAASQGANSALAGRVRKAAEVHFAEGMQQTKFDLYLSNIQRGVVRVFEKLRLQLLQHMQQTGGSDMAYAGGQSVAITQDELQGVYRLFAQAASDSLTPAARLAKQQAVAQIVTAYWMGVQQWTMLGCLNYMWHLNHRLLILAGERSPERYLGPEPAPPGQNVQAAPPQPGLPGGEAGSAGGPGQAPLMGQMVMPVQPAMPNFGAGSMNGAGMLQSSGMT